MASGVPMLCHDAITEAYSGKILYQYLDSELGDLFVAESAHGVCQLDLMDQGKKTEYIAMLARRWPSADIQRGTLSAINTAVSAKRLFSWSHPLHLGGTPFQQLVWKALVDIPFGTCWSYAAVAARLGKAGAARAVGQAVSTNPVAVIIPCHRVIRADGTIGEYRWGSSLKKQLLEMEKSSTAS